MGGPTAPQPRPHLVSQQQPQPRLTTSNLQQQAQPGLIYQRQQVRKISNFVFLIYLMLVAQCNLRQFFFF